MGLNIESLYKPIKSAKQDLLGIMDTLQLLADNATMFRGDVARVIPVQAKALQDKINEMISGSGQDSLSSLEAYLDTVPLGSLKNPLPSEREAGDDDTVDNPQSAAPTQPVDTRPHTENGPQSQLANESSDLSQYFKKTGQKSIRESKFDPAIGMTWQQIQESQDLDMDLGFDNGFDDDEVDPGFQRSMMERAINQGEEQHLTEAQANTPHSSQATSVKDWKLALKDVGLSDVGNAPGID